MTVETLNLMMTYVIEGWAIMSATYLSVGFTLSFLTRVKNGLKAKEAAAVMAKAEEVTNAERVAEMTAVAEKYAKSADKQQVKSGVKVPGQ
ncbi:hypothetical protein [Leptothoe spongobia]|uniref:Uncharacterized protein n=1 Tax=Leptothoe spongobia TAU-MAC 1115 TaxID=1967444 RepID=A0A947GKD0_9CYAN|nr:hypothetical protein [Leptothoe spongobia]MBT9313976.1 hypothetical protein [Leptothoe spongobia TAU-MAC 1115]